MPYTTEQIVDQLRQLAHPNAHTSDYVKARLVEAADEIERLCAYQNETAKAWTKLTESQEEEIEQLRSDLELRNQTALDRKEIIRGLEAEIERLRAALLGNRTK